MQLDDLTKIVLTSGLTILGGLIVYVAGQILARFFIDPYHEYRKIVGEIADTLVFYANVYTNPGMSTQERMDEAVEDSTSERESTSSASSIDSMVRCIC